MLYEAGYNIIDLYSATKGMNQKIAPELLKQEYSYYIENIMPDSLGEGKVRYGTSLIETVQDTIIKGFGFEAADGTSQQILYCNGYNPFLTYSNLVVIDSNHIHLTSANKDLFQPDTYLSLRYNSPRGLSPFLYFRILDVENPEGGDNIIIEVDANSFPDNLSDFYVREASNTIRYLSDTSISIEVQDDFIDEYYYSVGQSIKLNIDNLTLDLTIQSIDRPDTDNLVLTFNENTIPDFSGALVVTLDYESLVPNILNLYNSVGYIEVMDMETLEILSGVNQTITNLSVACVPRAEYFANMLWICNGTDPIMTWDGDEIRIYDEPVKEFANSFNRINDNNFSFISNSAFDIGKYQNNNSIKLKISGTIFDTTVANISVAENVITITTSNTIPNFTGQDRIELFYIDKPPAFSFMKAAHDRLWCLPAGTVGLDYREPANSLRFYYSYTAFNDGSPFRFFNENTKTVPSENIAAKHGSPDNLEAIVNISGHLAFMGRQKTQIWGGIDPLENNSQYTFSWVSTIPVGIYHGDLFVELANDVFFVSQNGFLSFGTLNVAKQFAASPVGNMDKLATEFIDTIDSNIGYRACRSFKYQTGGFCGFKIGLNNIIVSKHNTNLYWWCVFSGDFGNANSFLADLDDSLYLYLDNKIYRYADGVIGAHVYGDNNGQSFVEFVETKYVNDIKSRYANKRYEVQADYSSNIVINNRNTINIIVRGDLRDTFTLQDLYNFKSRGDILGTIPLVNGDGMNINNPNKNALGMRLDSPTRTDKGRLQFLSSNFSVSLVGQTKDGPFSLKRIRLFGIREK